MQDKRCCCLPLRSVSPALPSSPHRPPNGRRAPSRVSRCMADQNVTAEEKGGQVDYGRRWVRAQQAVRRGCAFPCDLFLFFPFLHQVLSCLRLKNKKQKNNPLLPSVPCKLPRNTRQRGIRRTTRCVNRWLNCHRIRVTVDLCALRAFKITLRTNNAELTFDL